ncbi:hypothetical protein EBB54_20600 [Schaedlerella arabinosiphila]|uniref:Helix-turn-helix domain-containing protein n=2 Tax=Schaedlerella arabinosiphila TaxID=2044587 RepID=A0A426DL06_9FIRM|nr:hypothetical protein EBB54_20600 [Schaedlerella arabinosiphila]
MGLKNYRKKVVLRLFLFGGEGMTKEQAERIKELRMQGKGYKAAASAVGLSRDIVRNYCRANGMEGYGEAVKLNLQREMAEDIAKPGA